MAEPDPAQSSESGGIPRAPRPGADPSAPSASQYMPELPYAEELQELLAGRYVVESFLGQGGMGAVYRGLQLPLKRPVAIKILQKKGEKGDFDFEERFKREAYAMASLTHPNIVQVYDCGDAGENFLFISMELVEGGDLSDAIKSGQVGTELALKLIPQICDGLQAAHERGIVHRDIKPANIFLTVDGRAKVADFGLAKKFDVKSTFVTKAGLGMGTPDYAAPEQFDGVADIDQRADIYSLGVMFYQMLTGKLPRGIWQKPSKLKPMDPRLDAVVSRAMEQDRIERYQTIGEMKADILQCRAMPSGASPSGIVTPAERPMPTQTGKAPTALPRTGNIPSSPSPTRTGNVPAALTNTGKVPTATRPTARPPARTGPTATAAPLHADETSSEPEKKSNTGMIAAAIGVAAVLAAGAFFVLKPKPAPLVPPPGAPSTSYASRSTPVPAPTPSSTSQASRSTPPSVAPAVIDTRPTAPVSGPPLPGAKTEVLTFAGHRYQALPDLLTWTEARGKAEQMGGHLATITSPEENEWIKATFITKLPKGLGLWLGGTNDGKPTEWRWVTGEPFKFTAWNLTEPTNAPREIGISFAFTDDGELGWVDISDSGFGRMDRRGGLLVEWEDTTSTIKVPLASSGPAPGTLNLLQGLDPAPDAIEGDWVMKEDGLHCDHAKGFARLAFNIPVPQEYDFRIRFTRKSGGNAVTQHIVLPDGRDVMWLMGGFNNDVSAWERVGGKIGNANPSTVKMGLQNGRRYECVVRVRKNQLQVELDGKVISTHAIANNQLDVVEAWKFPDSKKLGIGCQNPTLFHSVELIPLVVDTVAGTPSSPSLPVAASPAASVPPVPSPMAPAPVPVPAHAPSSPADPRAAQLEAGFRTRYDSEVQKPYDASVNSLNQSYVANGIARARAAAQQKGALDDVTALDAETARVQNHKPLPPADDDTLPASLKTLRATYRTALGNIQADRAKKAAPLYDLYLAALDGYVAELTKDNKVDEAQKAQAIRDEVAGQKSSLMESSAVSPTSVATTAVTPPPPASGRSPQKQTTASSSNSGPPVPIPPEALAPPKKAEHSRELAEWTLVKCKGRISIGEGPKIRQLNANATPMTSEDVPKGTFRMSLLDSANFRRVPLDTNWVEGETEFEDLQLWQVDFASPLALRGMKKLNTLRIRGSATALPDEQMLLWPPLPALKQLDIQGAFGNTGLRVLCERCPELNRLIIQARLTEGGLAPLQRLKNLNYFEVNSGTLSGTDLAFLGGLPKLDKITLNNMTLGGVDFSPLANVTEFAAINARLGDAEVKTLGNLKLLVNLRIPGNQITDASLPLLGTFTKLKSVDLANNTISGRAFASLAALKNLNQLVLASTQIDEAAFATLPALPALTDLRLQNNSKLGDGIATALSKHRGMMKLDLSNTAFGDAGLQTVCNDLPNLVELYIHNTKVTDTGIAALKRLKRIERIGLNDTSLTDAAIEHLKKLASLKYVEFRNTAVSPAAIAELRKALPQCQISSN